MGLSLPRDFVLKTCLTLLNHGARYEVEKFRQPGVREEIESKWNDIADAIKDVLDFVSGKTFIRCDKALPSYLVLIPLIYLRYHFEEAWHEARDRDTYLLRSSLSGAFSGTPDQLIDNLVAELRRSHSFDLNDVFGVIGQRTAVLNLPKTGFGKWDMARTAFICFSTCGTVTSITHPPTKIICHKWIIFFPKVSCVK